MVLERVVAGTYSKGSAEDHSPHNRGRAAGAGQEQRQQACGRPQGGEGEGVGVGEGEGEVRVGPWRANKRRAGGGRCGCARGLRTA